MTDPWAAPLNWHEPESTVEVKTVISEMELYAISLDDKEARANDEFRVCSSQVYLHEGNDADAVAYYEDIDLCTSVIADVTCPECLSWIHS